MEKVREVIQYKNYFEEFLLKQPKKVQDKIFKVIEIIEMYERVPSTRIMHWNFVTRQESAKKADIFQVWA